MLHFCANLKKNGSTIRIKKLIDSSVYQASLNGFEIFEISSVAFEKSSIKSLI